MAGKKVLVTGGNRGIGLAIAKGLAEKNLDVVIGSRNLDDGNRSARSIGAKAVALDVSCVDSIHKAVAEIGPIDVLVNNAGVMNETDLLEDWEDFEMAMAVMVHGPYHLIRAAVPSMRAHDFGRIVNVSSTWGAFSEGMIGPGSYGVAKAALNALTMACARKLPSTIKVNAMCPGWVQTRLGGEGATRSAEEGADTAVWLATLPGDGASGLFFRDRKEIPW